MEVLYFVDVLLLVFKLDVDIWCFGGNVIMNWICGVCLIDIVIGVFNVILLVLWLKELMIDEF